MLKYLLILLTLIIVVLYIYSMETPLQEFIMMHATSYYITKVYYVIVNEIVRDVINEKIVSKVIAEPFIDLSYGSTPIPTIVIKSVNSPPPYYIRLLAYDKYTGNEWLLSSGKEYSVTVNYQVLSKISLSSRGSECYLVKEEILNSSVKMRTTSELVMACYGINEAYTRVKLGNTTFFTLGNEFIVPLPANFLTTTILSIELNASHIIPLILTYVIPIPSSNSSNITLTLFIDESLKYIKMSDLANQSIDSLLIVSDGYGEIKEEKINVLNKYVINYSSVCSESFKPSLMIKDDACFKSLIKFTKDIICSKRGYANLSLGFIVRTLTDEIVGLTSYGPVDLSSYVNSTCRDLASIFLLKAHKGVCIHYASALSVMLRILGFNARLATGLIRVAYTNVNNSGLYVGFYIPHAWSEVLVCEGYVAFDPTPSQGSGNVPSYGTAINMYRAYRYRERAEEPYPGIKVLMKRALGEQATYSMHVPKSIVGIYDRIANFITTNITYIIIILLISILMLNSNTVLQGIAKALRLLGIRRGDIKLLAKKVMNEVYDSLGLRMPNHLTLRELIRNIRDRLDHELLILLERFVREYEELRYGGKGNADEVRKYAKLILRRLKIHAIT